MQLPTNLNTMATYSVPVGAGSEMVKLFEVGPKVLGASGAVSRRIKFIIPSDPLVTLGTRSLRLCYMGYQTAVGIDSVAWKEVHGADPENPEHLIFREVSLLNPGPSIHNPQPSTPNPKQPQTPNPTHCVLLVSPLIPQHSIINSQPSSLNSNPNQNSPLPEP